MHQPIVWLEQVQLRTVKKDLTVYTLLASILIYYFLEVVDLIEPKQNHLAESNNFIEVAYLINPVTASGTVTGAGLPYTGPIFRR